MSMPHVWGKRSILIVAAHHALSCAAEDAVAPSQDILGNMPMAVPEAPPASEPQMATPPPTLGGEADGMGPDFGVSDEETTEVEVVCAAQSAASELSRVHLAFVFDVSGSMGQAQGDDHSRFNLKWLPVVAASEAFFAATDSAAISASMTFFPTDSADTRCTDAAYVAPIVPLTPLPSPDFSAAIRGLNLTATSTWRQSTPTLHAFNGVASTLHAAAAGVENLTEAIVLVTDGVPQNCSEQANEIQTVANAVQASGIKTFVVGVGNPAGAGPADNLTYLHQFAAAGGTEQAFVIETGDPARTEADFRAVIDRIRGVAVSCNMEIPLPPAGTAFVPEKVNVVYGNASGDQRTLTYDQECVDAGAWRYDDVADPRSIVLCQNACDVAQRDVTARLSVEFGCERLGTPR
jgi:hypothetical protein